MRYVIIAGVAVFLLLALWPSVARRESASDCIVIASDGIVTMSPSGSHPAFHYHGIHRRTYIGFYSSDSTVKLTYWDETLGELGPEVTLWSEWGDGDDHAGPSVLVLQHQAGANAVHNGKILVATSGVRDDPPLQVRRSRQPETIVEWEEPITFDWEGLYPTLVELSDGAILVFYMKREILNGRNTGNTFQCYKESTDGGTTWSDRVILFAPAGARRVYGIYTTGPKGATVHAMFNLCPLEPTIGSWYRDVYYAHYDRASDLWQRADGTHYALPITPETGEIVYKSDATPGKEDHTWLSDIKVDQQGRPWLLSITNVDYAATGHTPGTNPGWNGAVQRHTYADSAWRTEVITENGAGQFGSYSYPAMAVLAESDPDVAFLTPYYDSEGNNTRIEKWRCEHGQWTRVNVICSEYNGFHFRPSTVRNGGSLEIVWCCSEKYRHSRQGQWESTLLAYPVR